MDLLFAVKKYLGEGKQIYFYMKMSLLCFQDRCGRVNRVHVLEFVEIMYK